MAIRSAARCSWCIYPKSLLASTLRSAEDVTAQRGKCTTDPSASPCITCRQNPRQIGSPALCTLQEFAEARRATGLSVAPQCIVTFPGVRCLTLPTEKLLLQFISLQCRRPRGCARRTGNLKPEWLRLEISFLTGIHN